MEEGVSKRTLFFCVKDYGGKEHKRAGCSEL